MVGRGAEAGLCRSENGILAAGGRVWGGWKGGGSMRGGLVKGRAWWVRSARGPFRRSGGAIRLFTRALWGPDREIGRRGGCHGLAAAAFRAIGWILEKRARALKPGSRAVFRAPMLRAPLRPRSAGYGDGGGCRFGGGARGARRRRDVWGSGRGLRLVLARRSARQRDAWGSEKLSAPSSALEGMRRSFRYARP